MGDHDGLESVITIGWNAHAKVSSSSPLAVRLLAAILP